ncbi:hypothetical protein SAMN05216559_3058 [Halomicrobium zhouii]|uniref:Sulfatase n=1 Tax=Halomicrobium zhouii TaxID=767519 RepID=A0A1I6LSV7_9EURY|nr:hypothetical protein [Halomicrobium zhouii]SFS06555.1 hypothetical protein SAMN05216559_3058 [Halomicrobium zhouii]
MTVGPRRALSEIRKNFSSFNWWRNRVLVPYLFGTATRLYPGYPGYENAVRVMDEDWDTMIVLDACRADIFQEVVDLSEFDGYETRISLGSHSSEFTRRNFQGEEFGDTVYVSANPHTSLEAGDAFYHIYELWEDQFDETAGVVLPDVVRDAAIEAHDRFPDKRLIVHFMQPHGPFVGSEVSDTVRDEAEYWRGYRENLEYVLPFAEDIIESVPGKTVVTADHGQIHASGLADKLGLDGHKPRLRLPGLVEVPWAVVEDERREIRTGETNEASGEQIQNRLEDLGYL